MAIDRYLAMTAAEIAAIRPLPHRLGYMACHFSPYSTGLSNLPRQLPPGAMLILTDRTPIRGHDPELIGQQLGDAAKNLQCSCVLLDLQRPGEAETADLVRHLIGVLPCPVGVARPYAEDLDRSILLPPVPPDTPISEYLAPWKGREIWLEIAPERLLLTLTREGCRSCPVETSRESLPHKDSLLHCRYRIDIRDDRAEFLLERSAADLAALLEESEALGVTLAVGLYQELGDIPA